MMANSGISFPGASSPSGPPSHIGGRAHLYRAMLRWTASPCNGEALRISNWVCLMSRMVYCSPTMLQLAVPGTTNRLVWAEFRNKLEAFTLFATADSTLGFDRSGLTNL